MKARIALLFQRARWGGRAPSGAITARDGSGDSGLSSREHGDTAPDPFWTQEENQTSSALRYTRRGCDSSPYPARAGVDGHVTEPDVRVFSTYRRATGQAGT